MDNPQRTYYDSGKIWREEYWVNGNYHRSDGPAYIEWYENGQKKYEAYWTHGTWHRADGPAFTWWYSTGEIIEQHFYLNHQRVTAYNVLDEKEAFAWALTYE